MSQSFQKSTKELSKCIAAQEVMQKAARDFLVAQTQWAQAFSGWAELDSNDTIKDTYAETAPIWAGWSAVQAEHIAQVRSIVYYEMGVLMGAAHDYMTATKETDKARTAVKKVQDKGGKGNPKVDAALPALKDALTSAKIKEARSRDRFSRLKQAVVKSMLQTLSSSYIRMGEHGAHLFEALYNCASLIPEDDTEDKNLLAAHKADCKAYVEEALETLPDSKLTGRYPGIFLHKKAEKFGKEKKRFFQLEKSSIQGSALFCYYQDVLRGVPFDRKGEIVIDKQTEVSTNGREIMLKNPDRKWILVSKTPDEANWWARLLEKSKLGIPDWAEMKPCEVPESDINDIEDARLRLDTVNRSSKAFSDTTKVGKSASPDAIDEEASEDLFVLTSDFASEEGEGTLDLRIGDRVIVGEKGDDWWFVATLDGVSDGWCPAAFLEATVGGGGQQQAIEEPQQSPVPTYVTGPRADEPVNDPTQPNWDDAPVVQDDVPQDDGVAEGRWVRAAYDNAGEEEDELSFNENDEIWQIQEADEYGWSRGILNGVEGIYPAAYVEDITD
eukprot:m.84709 g.84709  ORF g.84709 m.84709 type:complete len:556 (+) comp25790_c0_seq1:191-1858(+)